MNNNNIDIVYTEEVNNTIPEDIEKFRNEKHRNRLTNLILILIMLIILYMLINVIIVKDDFSCNMNNKCVYKTCGILNNTVHKTEFQRKFYSLYVIQKPIKNSNKYKGIYIVTFSKDKEIEVPERIFNEFDTETYLSNRNRHVVYYRTTEYIISVILLVILILGTLKFIRINVRQIKRKEEQRTIELEADKN